MAEQTESIASPSDTDALWQRVAGLRPGIRKHVQLHPQVFRGERWYVLQDELSGQHLRLNLRAYALLGRFDGRLSIQTIIDYLRDSENIDYSNEEVIELVAQLQHLGVLNGLPPRDAEQLLNQYDSKRAQVRWKRWLSPLMIRIPLLDPDVLLNRIIVHCRWLFTVRMLLVWLVIVCLGAGLAVLNTDALVTEFRSTIIKPANLVLIVLLYPLLKALHELSHGLAVKNWGGEVHETGITLLVLAPIPYVDASAASAFQAKSKRILVSALGIMTELFCASLALILWLLIEPGFLRDCAFGIFLIGAISTVVFNANPLLRFDGYFILQDAIEIPNLYTRASAYLRYLCRRYLFRVESVTSPVTASGEQGWLLGYGVLALCYRLLITLMIVSYLISKFLLLGIALALFALVQQVVMPLMKLLRYIWQSDDFGERRSRVCTIAGVAAVVLVAVLTLLPMPSSTRTQGVVWAPEDAQLMASSSGFVDAVFVEPGALVSAGQLLMRLVSPELERDIEVLEAEAQVLKIKVAQHRSNDVAEHSVALRDLQTLQQRLDELLSDRTGLDVYAGVNGRFSIAGTANLAGRFFHQGELIGQIIDVQQTVLRVAVPEHRSGRIHQGVESASVILAESLSRSLPARLDAETPSANQRLPSAALGVNGGGGIAIASHDPDGLTTASRVFHLQLAFVEQPQVLGVGERAFVTLRHKSEPLARRWIRSAQQLLLRRWPT